MKNLALAKLQALYKAKILPHAWLFVGPEPTVQQQVAWQFSTWMLCANQQDGVACGHCKSCSMLAAGAHPDFCSINPTEDRPNILLDDVRQLNTFLRQQPQFGPYKIVILHAADKLNLSAANALLKNLEEPGENSLIILLAPNPNLLLKTIVSRCQQLYFAPAVKDMTVTPDAVRQIFVDLKQVYIERIMTSVALVELLVKRWPNEVLYWFELALADLLKCTYTQDPKYVNYPELYADSCALSVQIGVEQLWQMLTRIQQARYSFGLGQRPNLQLILDEVFI